MKKKQPTYTQCSVCHVRDYTEKFHHQEGCRIADPTLPPVNRKCKHCKKDIAIRDFKSDYDFVPRKGAVVKGTTRIGISTRDAPTPPQQTGTWEDRIFDFEVSKEMIELLRNHANGKGGADVIQKRYRAFLRSERQKLLEQFEKIVGEDEINKVKHPEENPSYFWSVIGANKLRQQQRQKLREIEEKGV